MSHRQCGHPRPNGSACKAPALPGRERCCFHDPDMAARRAEGRKRGGINGSRPAAVLPASAPDAPLDTVKGVVDFLAQTCNQVRKGRLDARVGNCLAVLCGTLLRALEGSETEQRVAALEARLQAKGKAS